MARMKRLAVRSGPIGEGDLAGLLRRTGYQPSRETNPGRAPKVPKSKAPNQDFFNRAKKRGGPSRRYS